MNDSLYFDYAAATPLKPEVLEVMQPFFIKKFYNPSAVYLAGQAVRTDIETARAVVAKQLGVRHSEIIFTAGGTEANNIAIHGTLNQYKQGTIVTTPIEHDSVLGPATKHNLRFVKVDEDGRVDISSLTRAIDDSTVLVSIGYVNNEIGTVQSLKEVSLVLEDIRTERQKQSIALPLLLHTDACQAGNYLSLQAAPLGVDMMTLNGGKIYGPKQSGALYVRAGTQLDPVLQGGGQEFGLRSGTESAANIAGFAKALELAQASRHEAAAEMRELQDLFIREIKTKFLKAKINGSLKHRIANNVHITLPGEDNERLMMALDERGIQCAVGSACSASKDEPSHVLQALGLKSAEARASLRFSMGNASTVEGVKEAILQLQQIQTSEKG